MLAADELGGDNYRRGTWEKFRCAAIFNRCWLLGRRSK